MARKITRKSNKTSHVLNLLTSDPKRSESAVEPSADPAFESDAALQETFAPLIQSTDSADSTEQLSAPPSSESELTPTAPVCRRASSRKAAVPTANSNTMMDLSQALEERISQQIHDSLSAKLAEYEAADAKRLEAERKHSERIAAEAGLSPEPTPEEVPTEASTQQEDNIPESALVQEDLPAPTAPSNEDFEIVNIMDVMLNEFQQEFMDKFGMCTCRRCWLDTRALTLSSVPAKYVVLTYDTVDAMMNFYEHRYRGMLMAQLTQSCMKVMQNPHH